MLQMNAKASATCNWPYQCVIPLQALKAGGHLLIRDHGIYDITQLRCTYLVCCATSLCTSASLPICWPACNDIHCPPALQYVGLYSSYRYTRLSVDLQVK